MTRKIISHTHNIFSIFFFSNKIRMIKSNSVKAIRGHEVASLIEP